MASLRSLFLLRPSPGWLKRGGWSKREIFERSSSYMPNSYYALMPGRLSYSKHSITKTNSLHRAKGLLQSNDWRRKKLDIFKQISRLSSLFVFVSFTSHYFYLPYLREAFQNSVFFSVRSDFTWIYKYYKLFKKGNRVIEGVKKNTLFWRLPFINLSLRIKVEAINPVKGYKG